MLRSSAPSLLKSLATGSRSVVVSARSRRAGLLLALTGLLGTVSYDATHMLKEMAIRRAIGPSDTTVRREVAWRGLRTSAVGASLGLIAAVGVGSIVRGLLHGLPAYDPVTLLSVAAILVSSAVAATWAPARKALQLGPAELLREE